MCTHNYTHIHLVSWQDLLPVTSGYLRSPLQEPCSLQCTGDSALCKINMANIDSNKRVVTQALLGNSNSYTSSMGSGNTPPLPPLLYLFMCSDDSDKNVAWRKDLSCQWGLIPEFVSLCFNGHLNYFWRLRQSFDYHIQGWCTNSNWIFHLNKCKPRPPFRSWILLLGSLQIFCQTLPPSVNLRFSPE